MSDQCLPGLQGWPVNIASYVESTFTTQPNDIKLQFGLSGIPWIFDKVNGIFTIQGSHAFLMGGTQYVVKAIRICKPKQTGLSTGNPYAEYQIWGAPSSQYANPNTYAVLVIPIYSLSTSDVFGDALVNMATGQVTTLSNTIPRGDAVRIVRYATCVETTGSVTYTIQTAYWSTGIKATAEQVKALSLAENGIPVSILGDLPIATYTLTDGLKQNKAPQVIQNNFVANPYVKTPAITVSDPLFKSAFRLITGFQSTILETDTNAYKCIAINREKDIKDGKLVIDPSSGEPLDASQTSQAEKADTYTIEQRTIYPGDIAKWIGILFGLVIAIVVVYTLYIWFKKGMARPQDVGVTPTLSTNLQTVASN